MFCVIYRFQLKPHQLVSYKKCWDVITDHFIQHHGAIGSCLHQSANGLWVAYSRWPDKAMRDASWPGANEPDKALPPHVLEAIKTMQTIKKENENLEQYDDTEMNLVTDKL